MRTLNDQEVDQVAAGQSVVFIGSPQMIVDHSAVMADLMQRSGTSALAGAMAPGPIPLRILGGMGGGIVGGISAIYNIGNHVRTVTPRITITEIRSAPRGGMAGGSG